MADILSLEAIEKKRPSSIGTFLIRLVREKPLGAVGGIIALLLLVVGSFSGLIAPYGMNETWVGGILEPPSAQYWFGTDNLGRDVLSRVIFGARISVVVGLAATTLSIIISLFIGILCGYLGGIVDIVGQRLVDVVISVPNLLFAIMFVTVLGPGVLTLIFVLGLNTGIVGSRVIRGAVIGLRENMYIQAAESIGCSTSRIFARHLLPNIMAPTLVLFSTRVPVMILTEASLSFLGFGVPPPFPSWGSMLSGTGRSYFEVAPWMALYPGAALALVVYGVNMLGDAVRDLLDPRLRGGAGRYGTRVETGRRRERVVEGD